MAKPETSKQNPIEEIKEPKYTEEELLTIFDALMFEGEYREDITIKGKLKVTFRTRTGADTAAMTRELDGKKLNLMSSMQEYRALLGICYSITRYNDKDLSGMSLDNRIIFVEKLPTVVVSALSDALIEFDMKTEAAMQEKDAF